MTLATAPSTIAPNGPELPAAGVTATSPAMIPEPKPSADPLWPYNRPASIQNSPADTGATTVLSIASPADALASSADPALNPNQPTPKSPVPLPVIASESGPIESGG